MSIRPNSQNCRRTVTDSWRACAAIPSIAPAGGMRSSIDSPSRTIPGPTARPNGGTAPSRTQWSNAIITTAATSCVRIWPTSWQPANSLVGSRHSVGLHPTNTSLRFERQSPTGSPSIRSTRCRDRTLLRLSPRLNGKRSGIGQSILG